MDVYDLSLIERVRELGFYVIPKDRIESLEARCVISDMVRQRSYAAEAIKQEQYMMARNLCEALVSNPKLALWDCETWEAGALRYTVRMHVIKPKEAP